MLFFLFFGIFADLLYDRVGVEISLAGTRSHADTRNYARTRRRTCTLTHSRTLGKGKIGIICFNSALNPPLQNAGTALLSPPINWISDLLQRKTRHDPPPAYRKNITQIPHKTLPKAHTFRTDYTKKKIETHDTLADFLLFSVVALEIALFLLLFVVLSPHTDDGRRERTREESPLAPPQTTTDDAHKFTRKRNAQRSELSK